LLFAGLVTGVCVILAAASAYQHGFLVSVVSDCCADFKEVHELVIKRYSGWLIDPVKLEEISSKYFFWKEKIEATKHNILRYTAKL